MRRLVIASLMLLATACGKPFDVKTAPGFVPLENQESSSSTYAYRATTPEGVVIAVRVVEDEDRGDLGFWTQTISLHMREVQGYALLDASDVKSADGTPGKILRFGHDEDNKPYVYWLAIYLAQGRLFVVEAGGHKEQFERAQKNVEWTMSSVKVRCNGFLSPVLSSRTCNRW